MAKAKSAEKKELIAATREGDRKRYDALLKKIKAGSASETEMAEAKSLASKLARK